MLRSWHNRHMACRSGHVDHEVREVVLDDPTHSEGKLLLWVQGALGTGSVVRPEVWQGYAWVLLSLASLEIAVAVSLPQLPSIVATPHHKLEQSAHCQSHPVTNR